MFKEAIERVPFPVCGVALGTVALGNLLDNYVPGLRYALAVLAALMLCALVAKCVLVPGFFRENMENPISASVSGTFPMTVMQLSALVAPFWGPVAFVFWGAAVVAHMALILFFTVRYVFHLKLDEVFASWFIAYVGLAVASVTAPAFGMEAFGAGVFWFAFAALVVLVCLVTARYVARRQMAEATLPLICIYAAPFNLCVVGCLNSVEPAPLAFVTVLWAIGAVLYVVSAVNCVLCLRRDFYPSYAAFTFPFVISAMASLMLGRTAAAAGAPLAVVELLTPVQVVVAAVLVTFVVVRYVAFVAEPTVAHAEEEEAWDEVSLTDVPEGEDLVGYPRPVAEEAERLLAEKEAAVKA